MGSGALALRDQAEALRRAADRFTLLRLRVSSVILDVTRSADPHARRIAEQVREHWTGEEYAELGRIASGLRARARQLEGQAIALERASGRRMGGYGGAGFLGRGDEARHHVGSVARFAGTHSGASIGGYPLSPQSDPGVLPHPSHIVGAVTPEYDEPVD